LSARDPKIRVLEVSPVGGRIYSMNEFLPEVELRILCFF